LPIKIPCYQKKNFELRITFCVSEVFLERSERKIWVEARRRRTATGYALLADVFLFFFPTAVGIVLKNFQISFSVLDFGQRG